MARLAILLLFCGILISIPVFAQKPPVKFGNVSTEELKMTTYLPDTSAVAVILCDYGYFSRTQFMFSRLTRIKILKKEGTVWGSRVFPAYPKAFVRGITVNLENNEKVESKLKQESVFREKLYEQSERIRIAMPDVKVGSVLDIEFSGNSFPFGWEFQYDIPLKHSELVIENIPDISFRKNYFGFEPLSVKEENRWVANDMPAFKPEPYTSDPKNYLTKVEFDILEVNLVGYHEAFTTTWEDLCDHLYDSPSFGQALRTDAWMNKTSREILDKAGSDDEKLRMAHQFIKTFNWNESESLYTSSGSISFALKDNSGNSADINLALIQLLQKMGLEATPVLLSTRSHGYLSPIFPSLNKLNYVIARVKLNDKYILVDGTEKYAPYYLLPDRALNMFGRLYDPAKSEEVSLETDKTDNVLFYGFFNLDESQKFSGTVNFQRKDYNALDFRKKYYSFSSRDAYLEDMMKETPGLKVKDAKIENLDSLYLPVQDTYEVELWNKVDDAGEFLYFYPVFIDRMTENPFKVEKRLYPVDFIHGSEKTYSVSINIPENLEIIKLPVTVRKKLPDDSGYFTYQVSNIGNTIQVNYKLVMRKTIYTEAEYADVKEFFNQIVAKHAEPITLKKK